MVLTCKSGIPFTLTTGRVHLNPLRSMPSLNKTRRLEAEYTEMVILKQEIRQSHTELLIDPTMKHTGT